MAAFSLSFRVGDALIDRAIRLRLIEIPLFFIFILGGIFLHMQHIRGKIYSQEFSQQLMN
jgi:hypothetical protein